MAQQDMQRWPDKDVLFEFFAVVHAGMLQRSASFGPLVQEACSIGDNALLLERLLLIQEGVILDALALIEGLTGPTVWPGIQLTNAESGANLSQSPTWDWSAFKLEHARSTSSDNDRKVPG